MSHELRCYRCGASLAALTLPLSRHDACPQCAASLHSCRMCRHYDPRVPKQCREDDAEEVMDKEVANFCEWFVPSPDAFDPGRSREAARARSELEALFGAASTAEPEEDDLLKKAEDLFR
ncbi:MAG TPA: hypothetical protein VKZ85_13375 [Woeseiaceae bacterium]|nr:hypothetical protein [Woeseiaceae bacterium]